MRLILNLLWLIFGGGFGLGLTWLAAGLLLCVTIIGIPFGIGALRLAAYVFWPFGYELVAAEKLGKPKGGSLVLVGNILWFLLAGLWLALAHWGVAVYLCLTIIGIPFALAHLKIGLAALAPLGKRVAPTS
ncbi:MAG: YccF domain-containing protein [Planctomycetota bacterium]|jgi:uncharacterized membrane protein YccF (DUF307 family)